jgi:hypothetical protein
MSTPMSDERLAEIAARHQAATPGPWRWQGNTSSKSLELVAQRKWRFYVMGFVRWGMDSALPWFRDWSGDDVHGVMRRADKWFVRPESHNAWMVRGIDHPDAIAIERSWEDVDDLLAEVRRLSAALAAPTEAAS